MGGVIQKTANIYIQFRELKAGFPIEVAMWAKPQ